MKTPICDFVDEYNKIHPLRLHMPAHKGKAFLGFENRDITEINGADSLYEANGIIAESEKNASWLFGSETFFSTEGSSQCIRAMMYLVKLWGGSPLVIAGRNAHKSFLSAAALLDLEVEWLPSREGYLSCDFDFEELKTLLSRYKNRKLAVYLTSPDYLGNMADIKKASELCRKYGAMLLVDNAHGAYLKFLPESLHPLDSGADMCCDSAHKTLPVLTGGAYLHISDNAPKVFSENAKNALSLFGSTSPSYLILQSLDMANKYVSHGYGERLAEFVRVLENAKSVLREQGFEIIGCEPLKITVAPKKYGYTGTELAEILEKSFIFCEFSDKDYTVFMFSPENGSDAVQRFVSVLSDVPKREEIKQIPPKVEKAKKVLPLRKAVFSESEVVDCRKAKGRILSEFNIACPPAVPILVCGEEIDETAMECFEYYGIEQIRVVKQ